MTMQDTGVKEETTSSKQHDISRRTLLKIAGAGAGATALARPLFTSIAGEAASTFYS